MEFLMIVAGVLAGYWLGFRNGQQALIEGIARERLTCAVERQKRASEWLGQMLETEGRWEDKVWLWTPPHPISSFDPDREFLDRL